LCHSKKEEEAERESCGRKKAVADLVEDG